MKQFSKSTGEIEDQGGAMPALTGQVTVAIAATRAFEYVADLNNGPLWIPYLSSAQQTSESDGAALEALLTVSIGGQELTGTGQCVEWDPPTYFALEGTFDAGARFVLEVELEEGENGCTVYATVEFELATSGLGAAAARLVGERMLKSELEKAMTALRLQLNALETAAR
ncbi:MAG: SRPBCC family protein [Chloroflexota bacterium]